MSFYELDRPSAAPGLLDRIGGFFAALGAAGKSTMRSIAYARMMRALFEMDDATLGRIGITRDQIPAYVDRCLSKDLSV